VTEPNKSTIEQAPQEIDAIYGMVETCFDAEFHEPHVAYGAPRICLNCVEEILKDQRVEVDPGWWDLFKEEYYKFIVATFADAWIETWRSPSNRRSNLSRALSR
tara:strand:- start:558 stop:869 length:312 start_codon:yes stop_codon:yes gene_type:complete